MALAEQPSSDDAFDGVDEDGDEQPPVGDERHAVVWPEGLGPHPYHPDLPNLDIQKLGRWMIEQGLIIRTIMDVVVSHPRMTQLIRGALSRIPCSSMAPHVRERFLNSSLDVLTMEVEKNLLPEAINICLRDNEPSVDDMLGLRRVNTRNFGVYIVFVFWPNGLVNLYTGSGTSPRGGMEKRVCTHRGVSQLSNTSRVGKAIRDGATAVFRAVSIIKGTYNSHDVAYLTRQRFVASVTEAVFIDLWGTGISHSSDHAFIWGGNPSH